MQRINLDEFKLLIRLQEMTIIYYLYDTIYQNSNLFLLLYNYLFIYFNDNHLIYICKKS